jgi:hypothetical protein
MSFQGWDHSVRRLAHGFVFAIALSSSIQLSVAEEPASEELASDEPKASVAETRLKVMTDHVTEAIIASSDESVPKKLKDTPLFRYDDETRGYVDGTVWQLGNDGRPLAIVTAELHPNYLGSGKRIVYDLLSLTDKPFRLSSNDITNWTPMGSAVEMKPLPESPRPATSASRRLSQIKQISQRFSGTQGINETDPTSVTLRLLPREILRYAPGGENSDGAIFLLANGRNPALVLLIETDGDTWTYGTGRLSTPSTIELRLDDNVVWTQPEMRTLSMSGAYTALNNTAEFP